MTAGDAALIVLPLSLAVNGFFLRAVLAEVREIGRTLNGEKGVLVRLAVVEEQIENLPEPVRAPASRVPFSPALGGAQR